jgi:hypothetical protein
MSGFWSGDAHMGGVPALKGFLSLFFLEDLGRDDYLAVLKCPVLAGWGLGMHGG